MERQPDANSWMAGPIAWPIVIFLTLATSFVLLTPNAGSRRVPEVLQCRNNIGKNLGLALLNYHHDHGCFPPAVIADENGDPMHSWRVLILPYLDHGGLYRQYRFDEPWDGPNNRRLAEHMPSVFRCPADRPSEQNENSTLVRTRYVAVTGPGTAFDGTAAVRLEDITDDHAETIVLVETPGEPVHWMEPRDIRPEAFLRALAGGGRHQGATHAVNANASCRMLSADTPSDLVRAMTTIAGGEQIGDF